MLSQKARYALRALVELARAQGVQLTSGELAIRADAPRKFLEAILLELSRNQVVTSRRGKFGGYTLGRPASEISFAEVIRILDGRASAPGSASANAMTAQIWPPARSVKPCSAPATPRPMSWKPTAWPTPQRPELRKSCVQQIRPEGQPQSARPPASGSPATTCSAPGGA